MVHFALACFLPFSGGVVLEQHEFFAPPSIIFGAPQRLPYTTVSCLRIQRSSLTLSQHRLHLQLYFLTPQDDTTADSASAQLNIVATQHRYPPPPATLRHSEPLYGRSPYPRTFREDFLKTHFSDSISFLANIPLILSFSVKITIFKES